MAKARNGSRVAAPTEAIGLEAGRALFAAPCRFLAAAASAEALPRAELPEVAFWGRSNVGKSSLLNALTGRRDLARVSRTPGRTRAILFFALGERLVLVDLPGYGHARASRAEARAWSEFVERYLSERARLVRVCLLIDARRGVQPVDRSMIALLDAAAQSYEAVLTKADALAPAALEAVRGATAAELVRHAAAHPEIAVTSARTGRGIPELRQSLAALAAPHSFR